MGNCSLKSAIDGENPGFIRLLTNSGKIFEFRSPQLARDILEQYPGYNIFRQSHILSSPLSDQETLVGGQIYYLLPKGTNPRMLQVLPWQKNGVWKVKMVIGTKQLEEILAEEGNTEALIERLRMAATAAASGGTPRRSSGSWLVGQKKGLTWEGCI